MFGRINPSHPVVMAALCLGGVLVVNLLAKVLQISGMEVAPRFPWMTAAAFLLLFSIFNSVGSLFAADSMKYWGRSIYSFLGLVLGSGLLAYAFSSLSIGEAGSYRWIFVVLTFGYLVFVSIMNIARRIVEFAQREEWNHPRIRQKKRR